jgi:methylmalonyl-CoA mutase N-terminal domain/subunit
VAEKQIARLKALKESRDNVKVKEALEEIRKAAKDESANLMPKILEAVKVYATLGEICDVLREEFGEYRESIIL